MEEAFRRSSAIGREEGKTFRISFDLAFLAWGLAACGRLGDAFEVLEQGKSANPAWRETPILQLSTFISWLSGDFESAVAAGHEVILIDPGGSSRRRALGPVAATLAAAELDRLDEAEALLAKGRAAYGDRHWFLMLDTCWWAEAAVLRRRHRLGEAIAALRRAADHALDHEGWTWAGLFLADLAEVAAEAGVPEMAVQAAADLDRVAGHTEGPLHPSLAAIAGAWANLIAGRTEVAAEQAREAVASLSELGYQAFLGRAHDALGRSLAGSDRERAVAALKEADRLFESCGARWRRERTLEALRNLGTRGRRASVAGLGAEALTRREREVAALAARGRSAREIAAQLFIGERTVEFHLANAYSKLGVGSKVDLIRQAAELGL